LISCTCATEEKILTPFDLTPVYINQTAVPRAETVKYVGLYFDKRLTRKNHVATKRKQLDLKTREIN